MVIDQEIAKAREYIRRTGLMEVAQYASKHLCICVGIVRRELGYTEERAKNSLDALTRIGLLDDLKVHLDREPGEEPDEVTFYLFDSSLAQVLDSSK